MYIGNSNFEDGAVKFPSNGMSFESLSDVLDTQPLKRVFGHDTRIYSLLRHMLVIDPHERSTA